MKVLELCSHENEYASRSYEVSVEDKTKWWAALVMCARDWSCGNIADTDRYSQAILSPHDDIRGQVLVKALLNAYKVLVLCTV